MAFDICLELLSPARDNNSKHKVGVISDIASPRGNPE